MIITGQSNVTALMHQAVIDCETQIMKRKCRQPSLYCFVQESLINPTVLLGQGIDRFIKTKMFLIE